MTSSTRSSVRPAPAASADHGSTGAGSNGPASDGSSGPPPRGRSPRPRSPWWRFGFPIALVVLILAIPMLVWSGARVVLDSNDGKLVRRVTDPEAPGWEAVLEPTPTELVLLLDSRQQLQGISILILSGDDSGAMLQVPVETLSLLDGVGEISLAFSWFLSEEEGVRAGLGQLLQLSFASTQVIRTDEWASLVAPVSPLTINSPDAAVDATGAVVFPKGSIQVRADQVAAYLSARGPTETDVARLVRTEAFWRAWLVATANAGLSSVPPPADQGLGRFLAALGQGQVRFFTLPVTEASPGPPELYRAPPAVASATVAELVPFPVGPPGMRPTVRVLDGTGRLDHGETAAVSLGAAGAQVEVIGNAASFDEPITQLVYFDDTTRAEAERLRVALGVGQVVRSSERSSVDITIILGADAVGVPGIAPPAGASATQGGTGGTGG